MPKRQPAGLSGRRADEHPIMGDLLDPPTARPEGDHFAYPGLVDHFLIEFADPRALLANHEHPEEPAVRDRAATRHRKSLRARPTAEDSGGSVPDDAGLEGGEVIGWVSAAEEIEDGFQDASGEARERCCPPGEGEAFVHRPLLPCRVGHREHGNDLLGEDVQGIAGDAQCLDLSGEHALGHDGARDEVAPELGEDDSPTGGADLMAGASDPLQSGGDARRGLDLDDDVDRAHVDAEFEAARGHDRREPAGLEVLLDH